MIKLLNKNMECFVNYIKYKIKLEMINIYNIH